MNPAQQQLHQLWYQPGRIMHAGWWTSLGLDAWRDAYATQPLVRPSLDQLITDRLGHQGRVPQLDGLATTLLENETRRDALCLAMGLWVLRCPDYLLLRTYREALSRVLDDRAQNQLQWTLPAADAQPSSAPDALLETAWAAAGGWLAEATAPALRICKLFWPPGHVVAMTSPPEPALQKLSRWL